MRSTTARLVLPMVLCLSTSITAFAAGPSASQEQAINERLTLDQGTPAQAINAQTVSSLIAPSGGAGTVEQSAPFSLTPPVNLITILPSVSTGYDSNPIGTHDPKGSAFVDSGVTLANSVRHSS
jgi:hypothetical protein